MNTIVYLIRHSVRFSMNDINTYNTTQSNIIKNEKVILSVEGEKRAEILSNEKELQNIDTVYTSNCVRTLQTAKYLLEKQHLKVNIDERFDERRIGKPNDDLYKNWFELQFLDENFKTEGGESQKEVRARFNEAFEDVLAKNQGKRIAIFSHGYAILFFLMNWCKCEYAKDTDRLKFIYNGEEILNKKINAPEVFKLEFEDNNLKSIKNIVFEDLPYVEGTGKK